MTWYLLTHSFDFDETLYIGQAEAQYRNLPIIVSRLFTLKWAELQKMWKFLTGTWAVSQAFFWVMSTVTDWDRGIWSFKKKSSSLQPVIVDGIWTQDERKIKEIALERKMWTNIPSKIEERDRDKERAIEVEGWERERERGNNSDVRWVQKIFWRENQYGYSVGLVEEL